MECSNPRCKRPAGDGYKLCDPCRARARASYQKHKETHKANVTKYRKAIQDWLLEYLRQNPCIDCGEDRLVCLEFDHVRGEKITEVSTMISNGHRIEKVKAEVEKCDVVCANCHRVRTGHRFGWARSQANVVQR